MAVKVILDYEETPNLSEKEVEEVKKKLSIVENTLLEKLPKFLEYLDENEGNYIEIHWPIFDYGITIMMSKLREKFLISVLDHRNSKVYGNLLLEGFKCIDIKELKKLGTWSSWMKARSSVFKPDQ